MGTKNAHVNLDVNYGKEIKCNTKCLHVTYKIQMKTREIKKYMQDTSTYLYTMVMLALRSTQLCCHKPHVAQLIIHRFARPSPISSVDCVQVDADCPQLTDRCPPRYMTPSSYSYCQIVKHNMVKHVIPAPAVHRNEVKNLERVRTLRLV